MRGWKSIGVVTALLLSTALSARSSWTADEGKNVQQMITEAKTPADHQAIVTFYREESARLQQEATRHAELARWWTNLAGGEALGSARYEQAEHCRRFAGLLEKAAQEAQALAKGHESMPQSAAGSEQ